MYQNLPSFVLGFHGCDRDVGEAVLAGEPLTPSTNDYDWLGQGIYFWESSPERALSYAESIKRYKKRGKGAIKNPYVIGAVLDLGLCFNLTEEGALLELKSAYALLKATAAATGNPLPINSPGFEGDLDLLKRHLDCAVFENMHAARKKFDFPAYETARSPFNEGVALYPGASFREKTHIQICVREISCIKGYFRPLNDDGSLFQAHS
ncbi:hypothetical protein J2W43_001752 [Pseudomonas brassicacearum]|uniref:DUF3990 domain-containing protein n=1 Tax=Pseudomonas brassicacearum TaxID=930166 RepID=A0AAW8M7N3_9PSED|nr:hypothetical protein [Pseudomonas brassicacearum]MDR6957771.1 hypothetical protein [Pseudomonas brassicacearum]